MVSLIRYLTGVTAELSAAEICGWFVVDHSFDHLRLWTTWKQCEREYPKASFLDSKSPKSLVNQGKNRYRFVWELVQAGSTPVIPTTSSVHNRFKLWTLDIFLSNIVNASQTERFGISFEDLYPLLSCVNIEIVIRKDHVAIGRIDLYALCVVFCKDNDLITFNFRL